jgi:hypothetical protein
VGVKYKEIYLENEMNSVNVAQDATSQSAPVGAVTLTAAKNKAGRPMDPNSKLVRAKALYASLVTQGKNRKEILVELQNVLTLTEGSAAVYYHAAKKDSAKQTTV